MRGARDYRDHAAGPVEEYSFGSRLISVVGRELRQAVAEPGSVSMCGIMFGVA